MSFQFIHEVTVASRLITVSLFLVTAWGNDPSSREAQHDVSVSTSHEECSAFK